jgi:uncharacterized phage protein (TIGR02218 family)
MRDLPPGLQDHLDSGTTTLCHCWRLALRSGEVLGFTDHDRDLSIDGTLYEAGAGFTGSEIESSLGFSVDNLEAAGALQSGRLDAARLRAGDFDHAAIEIWRVNWQAVDQRLLLRKGHLGEVTVDQAGFTAEVRGLAHLLNQTAGRLYQYGCDAVAGDARCGVDLGQPAFSAAGTVTQVLPGARLKVSGLSSFPADWFTAGTITFTSGANAGRRMDIKHQGAGSPDVEVALWQAPALTIATGDGVSFRAGCDKQFTTCKAKFSNAANFRGFPHMPGSDFVFGYATASDGGNDGRSRFND